MPQRSAVTQLPEGIRAQLDTWLVHRGFSGYQELSEWLAGQGYAISKSALHRYGSAFEERTEKLRMATQMAQSLSEAAGDDAGAMNDALIRLAQGELFDLLLAAGEGEKAFSEVLPEVTLAVARLTRASVQQKKWQTEFREKAAAAADEVEQVARKGGLTDEAVQTIRKKILGVAG